VVERLRSVRISQFTPSFLAALQPTALKKVFKSLGGLYQERIHVRLQLTRGRETSR